MNHPDTHDPVERWLREDARRRPTLPDAGFSDRVMASLPAPRRSSSRLWKPMLIVGSTAMGVVLAVALAPAGTAISQGVVDLLGARGLTPSALTVLATIAATAIGCAILAAED